VIWSPDGSRIAFASDRTGARDIYWKTAGGAGADELVFKTADEAKSVEDWSADGKLLLFNVGTSEIFALP
jgi:Tol biopolymer transport system component